MRRSSGELLAARFWSKVRITDGCWEWTATRNAHGYGTITVGGTKRLAHRIAWEITFGPLMDQRHVLHHCDNPPCVRPDHLFRGTQADNLRDMFGKGRGRPAGFSSERQPDQTRRARGDDHWMHKHPERVARGSAHGKSKLTEDQVREIRNLSKGGWTLARLSAEYGVRMSTLSMVIRRETWAHVED